MNPKAVIRATILDSNHHRHGDGRIISPLYRKHWPQICVKHVGIYHRKHFSCIAIKKHLYPPIISTVRAEPAFFKCHGRAASQAAARGLAGAGGGAAGVTPARRAGAKAGNQAPLRRLGTISCIHAIRRSFCRSAAGVGGASAGVGGGLGADPSVALSLVGCQTPPSRPSLASHRMAARAKDAGESRAVGSAASNAREFAAGGSAGIARRPPPTSHAADPTVRPPAAAEERRLAAPPRRHRGAPA